MTKIFVIVLNTSLYFCGKEPFLTVVSVILMTLKVYAPTSFSVTHLHRSCPGSGAMSSAVYWKGCVITTALHKSKYAFCDTDTFIERV